MCVCVQVINLCGLMHGSFLTPHIDYLEEAVTVEPAVTVTKLMLQLQKFEESVSCRYRYMLCLHVADSLMFLYRAFHWIKQ